MIRYISTQGVLQISLFVPLLFLSLSNAVYAEDSYLDSLDKASGTKPASTVTAGEDGSAEALLVSDGRDEVESLLAQSYPEEHATYQKFSNSDKNEIIRLFESTEGKPDAVRVMKVINKIGLLSNSEW